MAKNTQVTFEIDDSTEAAIDELKAFFNVRTRSAAIRNAIALARVIAPNAKDKTVVVRDQNSIESKEVTIMVAR